MKLIWFCGLLVLIAQVNSSASAAPGTAIQTNAPVQAILAGLLSRDGSTLVNVASDADLDKRLQEMPDLTKGDQSDLVRQLLFFRLNTPDRRAAMLAGVILKRLGIEKEAVALGLLPLLEMNNSNAVETAQNWLGEVHASDKSRADFSVYARLLHDGRQSVSPGFVRYLCRASPMDALELLARNELEQEEADGIIAKARRQEAGDLEGLAAKNIWWLDLFVVDQIERSPDKRTPGLLQRLRQCSDPRVQDSLRRIDGK